MKDIRAHCVSSVNSYLLLWCVRQHSGYKDSVRDELQPGIHKARCFSWPQDVERVTRIKNSNIKTL